MYSSDGELIGRAVMVKTRDDSDGGRSWFWYEVVGTDPGTDPVASGTGVPLCFGCHSAGSDFILTGFPLRWRCRILGGGAAQGPHPLAAYHAGEDVISMNTQER